MMGRGPVRSYLRFGLIVSSFKACCVSSSRTYAVPTRQLSVHCHRNQGSVLHMRMVKAYQGHGPSCDPPALRDPLRWCSGPMRLNQPLYACDRKEEKDS